METFENSRRQLTADSCHLENHLNWPQWPVVVKRYTEKPNRYRDIWKIDIDTKVGIWNTGKCEIQLNTDISVRYFLTLSTWNFIPSYCRVQWPCFQWCYGLEAKVLASASASASASRIWPRPGFDLVVLLCNRAFFVQKSCKISGILLIFRQ